jgi:hypothetical protein
VTNAQAGINPHWIEYGTAPVRRPARGEFLYFVIDGKLMRKRSVRGVTARPFMRPAADAGFRSALRVIIDSFGPALEREAVRLAGRASRGTRR